MSSNCGCIEKHILTFYFSIKGNTTRQYREILLHRIFLDTDRNSPKSSF